MDVTFHESQFYFFDSQSSFQGEQRCAEGIPTLPMMIEVETKRFDKEGELDKEGVERFEVEKEGVKRVEEESFEEKGEPGTEGIKRVEEPKEKELLVYSRGIWSKRMNKETTLPPLPLLFSLSNEDSGYSFDTLSFEGDDLDAPIVVCLLYYGTSALSKGLRELPFLSCPEQFQKFKTFGLLSPSSPQICLTMPNKAKWV